MLVDNYIMPLPYRYELADGLTTIEVCPTNWEEFELGLVRDGLTINREITAELRFANEARVFINAAYEASRGVTLLFYVRQNDWTMLLSKTLLAEMNTYNDDLIECSVRFMESNIQKDIDKSGGVDYDIPVPYLQNGILAPDANILKYTGIYRDRTNRLSVTRAAWDAVDTDPLYKVLPALHTTAVPVSAFSFSASLCRVEVLTAGTHVFQLRVGTIKVRTEWVNTPDLVVCRIRAGKATILTDDNGKYLKYEGQKVGDETPVSKQWWYHVQYTDTIERTITISAQVGDVFCLCCKSDRPQGSVMAAENAYFRAISTEQSTFVNYEIPVVSYEWMLTRILEKIAPGATLTYNILNTHDTRMLASSSCLYQSDEPIITSNFDDIMKALKIEYGADYKINGNEVIVDYVDALFPDVSGGTITPATRPKRSYDDTHVFNAVKVGWETDENVVNGTLEYNCINTFTIQGEGDKTLELIHPFKGSPYTIEQFLLDKSSDTTETKTSDTDIFVFCCTPFVDKHATLERTGLTSNMPLMAYNVQLTPMRLLMANARYLGISTYKSGSGVAFTSTDRKADYSSKFTYEDAIIYENASNETLESLMEDRLFTPEVLEFDTSIDEVTVTPSHLGAYNYFTLIGEKNEYTYNIRIKNITLHQTGAKSQQWQTWIK